MRQLLSLSLAAVLVAGSLLLVNCSNPLESTPRPPEPPVLVDTLFLMDTLMISDSVDVTDTVFIMDTVIQIDTVVEFDTVIVADSVVYADTVRVVDTIVVPDSILSTDTLFVVDTVTVPDSIVWVDTVLVVDTVLRVDTLVVSDSVIQLDTVIVTDTAYIPVPDSTCTQTLCSRLSSHLPEIVWLLNNPEGLFRLEFVAEIEKGRPPQTLAVSVGGQLYAWQPVDADELILEVDLPPDAVIELTVENPKALGHSIDVCLTVSPR